MCQHRRQEPKCKGRKKNERERCCGADRQWSQSCIIQTGDIISYWSMKKRAVLFYLSQKWIMLTMKLGRIKIYGPILSLSKQAEDLSVWGWKSWDGNAGGLVFLTHRHKFKGAVTAQASHCLFIIPKKFRWACFASLTSLKCWLCELPGAVVVISKSLPHKQTLYLCYYLLLWYFNLIH